MGGYPQGGSGTAVIADAGMSAEEFSDMDVGVHAHLAPSNLNRLRRASSRSSSRTRRTIFKEKPDTSPGGKLHGNRVQTRIDVLEFELDDARRQQRTSQDQVAHIHQFARNADANARAMHQEAQHYAEEALEHHRSSQHRAHQTVCIGTELTTRMRFMEHNEQQHRDQVKQLESALVESDARQHLHRQETMMAATNYSALCSQMTNVNATSEQKDAELRAQACLVSALRAESGGMTQEIGEARKWLYEHNTRLTAATMCEEVTMKRLGDEERTAMIHRQVADTAKFASEEWAARFGDMKHLLENQERHLSQAVRLRDENDSEINHLKSEVEQSNRILQAASEVAGQRDAVAQQLNITNEESAEMKSRVWTLEDDLYKAFSKNADLVLEVESYKYAESGGSYGWGQDPAPTAVGVDSSFHGTFDAKPANSTMDKMLENLTKFDSRPLDKAKSLMGPNSRPPQSFRLDVGSEPPNVDSRRVSPRGVNHDSHDDVKTSRVPAADGSKNERQIYVGESQHPRKPAVPSFPTITSTGPWIKELSSNLVAAGKRIDSMEDDWIKECLSKTFDELSKSGMGLDGGEQLTRFTHLDNTLAWALLETKSQWPKRVQEKIDKEQHDLDKRPLKGRQIVSIILTSLKTDSSLLTTMSMINVYEIKDSWMGDKNITKFLDYHDSVYQNLDENSRQMMGIDPKLKWEVLHRAMASSKVLSEDWHHFERMPRNDSNKTYDYLRGLVDAHVTREDTKANLNARKVAMDKRRGKDSDAAAPATDGGKGKGKGKKGNKGKDANNTTSPTYKPNDKDGGKGGLNDQIVGKCFHFNKHHHDGGEACRFTAKDCKYKHDLMTKPEWEKVKTQRPRSLSPIRNPSKGKDGKGKDKGKKKSTYIDPARCCQQFLDSGKCDILVGSGECPKLHLLRKDLDRENKSRGEGKGAGKDK